MTRRQLQDRVQELELALGSVISWLMRTDPSNPRIRDLFTTLYPEVSQWPGEIELINTGLPVRSDDSRPGPTSGTSGPAQ